ncbi:MAG: thioredoxin domain-containing protein [Proteobacteria bacterium]|nr:thioredoxin domain-containing protein [Pseudomonadota bacterium]
MKPIWYVILALPGVIAVALIGAFILLRPDILEPGASTAELAKEVDGLKAGQAAILQELASLSRTLQAGPGRRPGPRRNVVLQASGAQVMGDAKARIAIIEFSDYQCPFCRRHFLNTMPKLVKDYVATGKVKYVLRDFPLGSIHPEAFAAAMAARCAGDQGKYKAMHDQFFAKQASLKQADWVAHAKVVGLDLAAFNQCMESKKYEAAVSEDMKAGIAAGVTGTPTFFIGPLDADGKTIRAGNIITGAQPYRVFQRALDSLLAAKG